MRILRWLCRIFERKSKITAESKELDEKIEAYSEFLEKLDGEDAELLNKVLGAKDEKSFEKLVDAKGSDNSAGESHSGIQICRDGKMGIGIPSKDEVINCVSNSSFKTIGESGWGWSKDHFDEPLYQRCRYIYDVYIGCGVIKLAGGIVCRNKGAPKHEELGEVVFIDPITNEVVVRLGDHRPERYFHFPSSPMQTVTE